jgi:DMSO/TMAO reductase YedYZ molybdopterin-dependent catalytic subunit
MSAGHPLAVTLAGEVEQPDKVDLGDLGELSRADLIVDFYWREGWSRPGQTYRGVPLATLLRLVKARPTAHYVTVASGGYSIVLTREQAEDQRLLVALELDGEPLPAPRLVGPSEWDCFMSVKDVDYIELTETAALASGPSIALARIGR